MAWLRYRLDASRGAESLHRSKRRDVDPYRVVPNCIKADTPAIQLSVSIYDADLTNTIDRTSSIEQIARYFDERNAPGFASLVRALGHCQRGDVHDASHEFFTFLGARDQWFDFEFRGASNGCIIEI